MRRREKKYQNRFETIRNVISRQRFIHADSQTLRRLRPDLHLSLSPNLRLSLSVCVSIFISISSKFHSVIERAFIHSCWLPPLGLLGPPLPHASRQHSQLMIILSHSLPLFNLVQKTKRTWKKTEKTKKQREVKEGEEEKRQELHEKRRTNKNQIRLLWFFFLFCLTDPLPTPHRPNPIRTRTNINHNFRCPLGEREIIFIRRFYGTNPRSEKVSIANLTASARSQLSPIADSR